MTRTLPSKTIPRPVSKYPVESFLATLDSDCWAIKIEVPVGISRWSVWRGARRAVAKAGPGLKLRARFRPGTNYKDGYWAFWVERA